MVPRGHLCSSVLRKSCLKSPRLPLLLPKSGETQKREAGGAWSWWEREGESPPCPPANPSSARRGISNNKPLRSGPDGFDLTTKQGGLGSFQSLLRGWILCKQQRATWCKSRLELQTAQLIPEMLGLPSLWGCPPAPWELMGSQPSAGHRAVPNARGLCVSHVDVSGREEVKGSERQSWRIPSCNLRLGQAFTLGRAQRCLGLTPLHGVGSERSPETPVVAGAAQSLVSASQRQGGGSGQCHPVPVTRQGAAHRTVMLVLGFTLLLPQIPPLERGAGRV